MVGEFITHDSMRRLGGLNHGSAAGLYIPGAKLLGRYPPKSGLVMLIVILPVMTPLRHPVNRLQKALRSRDQSRS
jgi:hypothetical protein